MLSDSHYYFHKAADVLGLSDQVRTILLTPRRTVKVGINIEAEDGSLRSYEGFRVQHNMARGPMKGGLRYHPSMDEDHAGALANLMTWKTASYFEWVQNIQQFKWDEEQVNHELDKKMSKAFRAVSEVAGTHRIDMRTAAFVLAIRRVGKAALARIHLKSDLPF